MDSVEGAKQTSGLRRGTSANVGDFSLSVSLFLHLTETNARTCSTDENLATDGGASRVCAISMSKTHRRDRTSLFTSLLTIIDGTDANWVVMSFVLLLLLLRISILTALEKKASTGGHRRLIESPKCHQLSVLAMFLFQGIFSSFVWLPFRIGTKTRLLF